MDIKTLYNMVRNTSDSASRTLDPPVETTLRYSGYPAYIEQYNAYRQITIELFGDEAKALFLPLAHGYWMDPEKELSRLWRKHFEDVAVRLATLTAYLQSKLGDTEQRVQGIIDLVEANLRPSIYNDPDKEKAVQDILETIFRARSLPYLREKVHIKYSSKTFVPDFAFDSLSLAVEAKLCNRDGREKEIIDEVNADILAYKTKYTSIVFVIYDLGFIRDVAQFKSDIEMIPNVYAIVIKK